MATAVEAARTLVHRNLAGPGHEVCVGSYRGCRRCVALLAGVAAGWLVGMVVPISLVALVVVIPLLMDLVRTRIFGARWVGPIVSVTSFLAGSAVSAVGVTMLQGLT